MSSRRSIFLLSLAPSLVCLLLGVWQLDRRVWKQGLLREITERCEGGEVSSLPSVKMWRTLDNEQWRWRRVRLRGRFDHAKSVQLWRSGAWHIVTPLQLGGGFVLIDRGVVKDRPEGVQVLEAVLWPSARRGFFDPDGRAQKKKFVRNVEEISVSLRLRSPVFGLIGDMSLGCPQLRDPHLNYALTWFALMLGIPLMALLGRHAKKEED